jgi:hypothetical protein
MQGFEQIPEWIGTAVLGAVVAVIGYVLKGIAEWIGDLLAKTRAQRARLVELMSLLKALKASQSAQIEICNRLQQVIFERDSELSKSELGFEELFAKAYPSMTEEEKELHTFIRTVTVNTIKPLNESILQWLSDDTYFKAKTWGVGFHVEVATKLAELEAHLLLWRAHFMAWIPESPSHSLVYLPDDERHGAGFPSGIEDDVLKLLKKRWMIGG